MSTTPPGAHLPGRAAKPAPEPPAATRAHFARPCGHTLAAPGEPAAAPGVPDREDSPRWSHATGGTATRLTPHQPSRNHQLRPPLNRARPGPMPLAKRRSHPPGGRQPVVGFIVVEQLYAQGAHGLSSYSRLGPTALSSRNPT